MAPAFLCDRKCKLLNFYIDKSKHLYYNNNYTVFEKYLLTFCAHSNIINVRTEKGGENIVPPSQGRPKSDNPKTERLFIRVTPKEKNEIQDFTKKTGYTLLELLKLGIASVSINK